ncbi:hypothetical protein KIY83_gp45 [Mycobacterium phage Fameo]|uniref:Uncharacterized protein n=2 Tax=Turbidovirus TaxID=2948936 RepID=A0A220NSD3_9CAUD|nr:hypothetical protein KIY83_gp45 [Mycobacterium phage Fameo]YP_010063947.1 hypothetical protein KIY85_gp44 [Mycobacterium phage Heffalump]ASJ79741.1 hypothetical protein SEA_HEFFALUMP_44 [Mycobacterium phage Heffalump]AVR76815.1 hypothetical protein SEA_FAMEO_45 [Mycobacterium phage Fameo]
MSDRIEVIMAVPVDLALPGDVQGVSLRRKAIELMEEIATVDENSVRYKGFSDECTVVLRPGEYMTMWQRNLRAVLFYADGKAKEGVVGPVVHEDSETRFFSKAEVNRNPYAA